MLGIGFSIKLKPKTPKPPEIIITFSYCFRGDFDVYFKEIYDKRRLLIFIDGREIILKAKNGN